MNGDPACGHVLTGGDVLDAATPAAGLLDGIDTVTVVPLAAAYARPDATADRIERWAKARGTAAVAVPTVRRTDSLDPGIVATVAAAAGILVLDGAEAHLVGALKRTPLLDAILSRAAEVPVVWSGASAAAACDPMVDDRGGALTVGLGVVDDVIVVPAWQDWSRDTRRRLRRLIPAGRTLVGLPTGSAIVPGPAGWETVGPGVEAERDGEPVALSPRS